MFDTFPHSARLAALCLWAGAAAQADALSPVAVTVAPAPGLAFSFEMTPEFYASSKAGSYALGDLAETVFKIGLSKALPHGLSLAGTLSETIRVPDSSGEGSSYAQAEAVLGYKWQVSPDVSMPVAATLGYAFGEAPKIDPSDPAAPEAYYAINVAANWKIDDRLTWNVVNARYRNAFSQDWVTPKLTTGVTYAMSETGTVFGAIGKSWKDTGSGMLNDKYSISFGLRYQF